MLDPEAERLRAEINLRREASLRFMVFVEENPRSALRLPYVVGRYLEENSPRRSLDACECDLVRLDRHTRRMVEGQQVCGYDGREWPCFDYLDLLYAYGLLEIPRMGAQQ